MTSRLLIMLLLLLVAGCAQAQQTASIAGSVTDPAGAAVAGARVALQNRETLAVRQTQTVNGLYAFPQLQPGTYSLTVNAKGFEAASQQNFTVAVGQQVTLNFSLNVAKISENVVVQENAPAAADVSTGTVFGAEIRELPLNGRSYDQLMTLDPGVVNYSNEKNNNTPGISNSAVGYMFAVSGRRPQENLFLLDGIEYTGSAEINMTPGGASEQLLGVDAIREFNVLTDTFGAEYGKRPGAQVLIVDRSGSDEVHGSVYEFLRNSDFDARNFFDLKSTPAFRRNQFGGSLGGPLMRNKTFLFGNYEGYRQTLDLTDVTLVPDNNARMGVLPAGKTVAVSPATRQLLSLWPVQNGPELGSGIAEAFSNPQQTVREDFGSTRLDQILSSNDTLAASYTVDDSGDHTPTQDPFALDIENLREQVASLSETHVFSPQVVNTATAGFSRASYFYTGQPSVSGTPSFIAGEPTGAVVIGGSATPNTASSITMAGSNYGSHLFAARNLFTGQDQIAWTRGLHQITAGIWIQRIQSNDELALGQFGQATFANLQTFLQGIVTTFTSVPSPTPLGWRSLESAEFVQDRMALTRQLTLTLGFRNESTNGWNEAHGRAATFVFGPSGALQTQPHVGSSALLVNNARFLPQPRAALAWDAAGTGATVVRAGFGMYNDLQDALSYRLDQNAPFNTSITLSNLPLSSLPIVPGNIPGNYKIAPAGVLPDLATPTVMEWNISLEQSLGRNAVISVGYTGSRAYHETLSADLNQPFQPFGVKPGTPLANPALASTWTWVSWANSNYNALKLDLSRRFTNGPQLRAAYTWSKCLDNGDTLNASAAANAPGLAENARDLALDYGPCTFDIRQVLTGGLVYELPFARHSSGFLRTAASGWSINALLSYDSGLPFTPELSFNPSNNGNTTNPVRPSLNPSFSGPIIIGSPNRYFNPNAFLVPANGTYGNLGRNALTGPGLVDLDVALLKNFPITEALRLQLRGEAFNVVNHPNFNTPNLVVFTSPTAPPSGSAGVITSTATTSRQIQIAAKLIW